MSKLRLTLTPGDLRTVQVALLSAIRANPMESLRQSVTDYLIVAELSALYNKVETKVRDLEWFSTTRSVAGKVIPLTLTRPEALALYLLLESELDSPDDTDTAVVGFERPTPAPPLTYERTLFQQLLAQIHQTYLL